MHESSTVNQSEDIDLILLTEKTVRFFRRYKWIYLIAILLGLAVGILAFNRIPKAYKSRMVIHSFTLSNADYMQLIDNWNNLLRRGEHEALAVDLQTSVSVIGKVIEIKANEIQKVFTPNNPNGVFIEVYVK